MSKEKVTTTPPDDSLPEVNVDSEINFAAAEIEELLADGPVIRRGRPTVAKPLLEMEEDIGSLVSWESPS